MDAVMDMEQEQQAPAPAVQQLPEESAASASVPGPETSLDRAAPAVAESPLIPASNLQPEQPTTGVPVALIGDTVSLTPLGGPRADTPSSAPVQHVASTPIESPFSNGVGPSAEATPMDETPAGSAGAGEVVEPESEGVDPPQGSKISWTGQEKFEAVQAILNQNKMLIREINSNHDARLPQGLALNVGLIRELNLNVARVVDLYSDLAKAVDQLSADDEELDDSEDEQPEDIKMEA